MISTEMPRRRSCSSHCWIGDQASESFSRGPAVRLAGLHSAAVNINATPPRARFGPRATERIAASSALFDHFVSQQLHRYRYVDAERLGGLHIDDQLEFGRRLHGKVAGLGTL